MGCELWPDQPIRCGGLDLKTISIKDRIISSHAAIALFVVVADLIFGLLRDRIPLPPSPPVLLARLGLGLSRRLDRARRGKKALMMRGALMTILLCGVAVVAGLALEALSANATYGVAIEAMVLWSCLRIAKPLARLREAGRGNDKDGKLARTALEQTAVSFLHFVVAPLFWFVVAGLPGLLVAVACWGLERAAARGEGRSPEFGLAAQSLSRLVVWFPTRIAEAIIAVSALAVPRGRPVKALSQAWSQSGDFGPIAALAGGLGVALTGPSRSWIGGGSAQIARSDLTRAAWLYSAALLVTAALLAGTALFGERLLA